MKILLTAINAKYIHSNPAVYSLAAYANGNLSEEEKEKCQIEIAEYTINHRTETIIADIYKKKPDVLAFSGYIWNWEYVQEVMTELHKLMPNVPIYLGGPEVSFTAEAIQKQYPFLEGIMIGEGEETFLELCRAHIENRDAKLLAGISGEPRGLVNINDIPFFYDDMSAFEHRIVYYESSRGCPYRCSYCLSSIDKTVRLRDLELVKKELQFFLDLKIPQVKFIDRTFNCNPAHAIEIWKYIKEHDNGITNFHFEIAADLMTEEALELIADMRPGLIQLEIGVQSTNEKTLEAINRKTDIRKIEETTAAKDMMVLKGSPSFSGLRDIIPSLWRA